MILDNILYSFRRCPYAIRARFALKYAGISCLLREVDLKNKPGEMIKISPKATVPVLVVKDKVLEESLDIVRWALDCNDPDNYLDLTNEQQIKIDKLISTNDKDMVKYFRMYKYPDLHPEISLDDTRDKLHHYFQDLDSLISSNGFLVTDHPTIADIAIFPFIRQVARINEEDFSSLPFKNLIRWLAFFLQHEAFTLAMQKFPVWQSGEGERF